MTPALSVALRFLVGIVVETEEKHPYGFISDELCSDHLSLAHGPHKMFPRTATMHPGLTVILI